MTSCFVCKRDAAEVVGELWYRALNAGGEVEAILCGRADYRHSRLGSDLRRPIQGARRVVLLDAFVSGPWRCRSRSTGDEA